MSTTGCPRGVARERYRPALHDPSLRRVRYDPQSCEDAVADAGPRDEDSIHMSRRTAEPNSMRGSHAVLQGTASDGWTTVITPQRSWFDWRLRLLWRFRELIVIFVWRDYVSAYKQTILGPAWHVIQPLLTTL